MPEKNSTQSTSVTSEPSPEELADQAKAIEAERVELEKLEKQVKTEEEKFSLKRRREDLDKRKGELEELRRLEKEREKSKLEEEKEKAEREREEKKRQKEEEKRKKQEERDRKRAEEEERQYIEELCSFLPEDERHQLSWALFKCEPGKADSHITTIPLDPSVNIFDQVRQQCPEGGDFKLKLQKGGTYATRQALKQMVKSDSAKDMVDEMPLHLKIRLYEKDEGLSPYTSRFGRIGRFGVDQGPEMGPRYPGRMVRPGLADIQKSPEEVEFQKEKEKAERDERKDFIKEIGRERDARLREANEAHTRQMEIFQKLMAEGKTSSADMQTMLKTIQDNYGSQIDAIKDLYSKQLEDVRQELRRSRESDGKGGDTLALVQVLKDSSAGQMQAMKDSSSAQAEALKAATTSQAQTLKEVISLQMTAMKDMVEKTTDRFTKVVEDMNKDRERDRDQQREERKREREAMEKERDRDRGAQKAERDRDREMNRNLIDMWKEQANKKGEFEGLTKSVMAMAQSVMAGTAKSIESQISVASRVTKMLRKLDDDDKSEKEEPEKTNLERILEAINPPLMKVLDIAVEQAKQGKPIEEIREGAESLFKQQVHQNVQKPPASAGPNVNPAEAAAAAEAAREAAEEPQKDMFEQLLEENREDVIPIVCAAIEKDADEDWLCGMVLSPDVPAGVRTAMALFPTKKVITLFKKFATGEEKEVLSRDAAEPYIKKVQDRLMVVQRKLKEAEQEIERRDQEKKSSEGVSGDRPEAKSA